MSKVVKNQKKQSPKKVQQEEVVFIFGKRVLQYEEIVLNGVNRVKAKLDDLTEVILSPDEFFNS